MSARIKIISYSLWGNEPKYTIGAIENIKLSREIYPDWICRFYVDDSVNEENINNIIDNDGQVVLVGKSKDAFHGMFWRFLANDDPNMDVFISRDCDSRLSYREKYAVDEWLSSDACLHIMHDHKFHRPVPILGGMWGLKRGCLSDIKSKIEKWANYKTKGIDQSFLNKEVWPIFKNNCFRHDGIGFSQWGEYHPFPNHPESKIDVKYVGQMFDENNKPIAPAPGVI